MITINECVELSTREIFVLKNDEIPRNKIYFIKNWIPVPVKPEIIIIFKSKKVEAN